MAYQKVYVNTNTPTAYEAKLGYVSTRTGRYISRNPYSHDTIVASKGMPTASSVAAYLQPSSNTMNQIGAKAYDRFYDSVKGQTAAIGANVGEWRSSLEMVATRAAMLRKAWVNLRRGNVLGAVKALGIPPDSKRVSKIVRGRRRPGKVSKKHFASSTWLELHFGWSPLVGDIYGAMDVLQTPKFGQIKSVGSASAPFVSEQYSSWLNRYASGTVGTRYEGVFQVDNPNAFLADRMGLTNPATIAWELVPFSFVVDWFTNVGQVLGSLNDHAGLTWLYGSKSVKITAAGYSEYFGVTQTISRQYQERFILGGPPLPSLYLKSPLGGPARAATQIALLVGLFLKP